MHIMIREAFRCGKDFICAKVKYKAAATYTEFIIDNQIPSFDPFNCNDGKKLLDETTNIKKNEGLTGYSYYNAFSILYTVMRKRIEEIIGRFHPENGITPRDPQTNNRIYDEI